MSGLLMHPNVSLQIIIITKQCRIPLDAGHPIYNSRFVWAKIIHSIFSRLGVVDKCVRSPILALVTLLDKSYRPGRCEDVGRC